MPPKPRAAGKPGQPPAGRPPAGMLAVAALGFVGIGVVIVLALVARSGSNEPVGDARAALEAAGCSLETAAALPPGDHSITAPNGTSAAWNTDPPTSGPHYAQPVLWGAYTDPVNTAQLVHNLEHGGVFVLYGSDVPDATVAELKSFYDNHTRGTVLAPRSSFGDTIALGAWTTDGDSSEGTAFVARCTTFDEPAFSAFFDAYQFRGPERFPADSLKPGT